jgi:hypothetical protein
VFALCKRCAEEKAVNCSHNDEERSFTDFFVSSELYASLDIGYVILQVYEVLQFDKKSNMLFKGFVDTNFLQKFVSTPFPSSTTVEERRRLCERFYERTGLVVHASDVKSNPVMKGFSKTNLNGLYGKWSERSDKLQTVFLTDYKTLTQFLFDRDDISISELYLFPNEHKVFLAYTFKDGGNVNVLNYANCVLSAFVAAYGRLVLYNMLSKIPQGCLLYGDTDSCLYLSPKGAEPALKTGGNWLGELTDETEAKYGPGAKIEQYVSLGPKSYTLVYSIEENGCKRYVETTRFKGVKRSVANSKLLTFEQMVKLLRRETPPLKIEVPFQIRRSRGESKVFNYPTFKTVEYNYDKRFTLPDYSTLPFGYLRN